MKTVNVSAYGDPEVVLSVVDAPRPAPAADEILVRIVASSVNAGDWHVIRGTPGVVRLMFGIRKPKIKAPGSDVAGIVEAVGSSVEGYSPGDRVFGELSGHKMGAWSEYVAAPAQVFAHAPERVPLADVGALPVSGITALQALRDQAQVSAGHAVLVIGASGGVGAFAVQIAVAMGARVTGVCSTRKVEMVRSLGAHDVIDYTKTDVTENGIRYDVIVDTGAYRSIFDYADSLSPQGRYVLVGGSDAQLWQAMFLGRFRSQKNGKRFLSFLAKPNQRDLQALATMVDEGSLRMVVGARYSLEEAAEAVRTLEGGSSIGKVVFDIGSP